MQGERLLDQAKLLSQEEIQKDRPAVPTIQDLLVLGGCQCAVGKNGEGWLYTGLAIRMIKDSGLHLSIRMSTIEPEDFETLKRLYLSSFLWDKSILMPRPSPIPANYVIPTSLFVGPLRGEESGSHSIFYEQEMTYSPVTGYSATAFSHFVELATLVNEAFKYIFGARTQNVDLSRLRFFEDKLRKFYQELPREFQLGENMPNSVWHPPHICCLNILYRTMHILIYRPYFLKENTQSSKDRAIFEHASAVCIKEAMPVNIVF